jgi:hypothetical protein
MIQANPAEAFEQAVEDWVGRALAEGAGSFAAVLRRLPGVPPGDALRAIRKVTSTSLPDRFFRCGVAGERSLPQTMSRGWPAPHPLDYDWRFAPETAESLSANCIELAPEGSEIALLGAPSLVPPLARAGGHARGQGVTLIDGGAAMTRAVRLAFPSANVACLDLAYGPEVARTRSARVVMADPPWYPEHVTSFLWAAGRLCRPGGHVLVSLPAIGTRPGLEAERAELLALAGGWGLRLVRLESAALTYLSPRFEQNAHRAAGLRGVPLEWRRGDLAVFENISAAQRPRPAIRSQPDRWEEIAVGSTRIKLRVRAEDGFRDPALLPIVPGDILPTVSRRDARRERVDVWTSGNRVFATRGALIVREMLLAAGSDPIIAVSKGLGRELDWQEVILVGRAARQISDLIRIEMADEEEACGRRPQISVGA